VPALSTRKILHDGIAAYFGGTYQPDERCWQTGPLLQAGLGTVRKGWGKLLNDRDYTAGMPPGRNMGAVMIVELGQDDEYREAIAGSPALDGQGNIIAGGIKRIDNRCVLQVWHLAQKDYAEDAADDIDELVEAIKQRIRVDRTLGGICTQAGEGKFGIKTVVGRPGVDKNGRTGTWLTISFECMTQIIA
jgi:hypothetical protein